MKKAILGKLIVWLVTAVLFSGCVFGVLLLYIQRVTDHATEELGTLYMSEMMARMQDHFETIVDMKTREASHIAFHSDNARGERLSMRMEAEQLGFEYLALYNEAGACETILGEAAWFRGLDRFIGDVLAGETAATTGYLTDGGGKYIVFGVPACHEMVSGGKSAVMLAGFSVEKLYGYIDLDKMEQWGGSAGVQIVLTNGAYVLQDAGIQETNFYDRIRNVGSFVGMDTDTGVARIEKAMARGSSFSYMVSAQGEQFHFYGAAAKAPGDWYFVLSMPQGAPDAAIAFQSESSVRAFMIACAVVLLLFFFVFHAYLRLSMQQLEQTEQARAEAEAASRAKSTFLFNASHDIRTPMNAIQGFARIIAMHPDDGSLVREAIGKINQSSSTLMQLLNEVLELSRIESGKVELNAAPMDLSKQMDNMQTMFQQEMQEAGVEFSVETDLVHSAVLCDSLKLTQILMNLLSNARKFTPAGGRVICGVKELSSDGAHGEYRFYVHDTGIGMSEEFQERAFDQFERERTSTVSGVQGSGLGLSIIKRLVDRMQGTCTLKSRLGEGTQVEVILRLPLTEFKPEDVAADIPEVDLEGRHVLLVEDNDFNREITRYIIEALGMTVEEACDGAVALDILCAAPENTFDLVLMDIQMPVMDGFEAARKIRSLEKPVLRDIPIIAITANAFREDVERCMEAGMNAHVCKPVEPDKLRAAMAELLN